MQHKFWSVGFVVSDWQCIEHGQVDDAQKRKVSRNLMLSNNFSKLHLKPVRTSERTQPVSYKGPWGDAL